MNKRSGFYPARPLMRRVRRWCRRPVGCCGPRRFVRWGWLESLEIRVQRGKLKQRTCDEYRRLLHCYVLSRFAAVAIGSITPQAAERFAAELLSGAPHTPTPSPANSKAQLAQGVDHLQIRARRPLSPATFKHAWGVFGRVLRYAVRKSAIAVNPLDNTEIEGGYAVGTRTASRRTR